MSEFTEHSKKRTEALTHYLLGLTDDQDGAELIEKYKIPETAFEPLEVVYALDNIVAEKRDFEKIKTASNKLFNILYKSLTALNTKEYTRVPFLKILVNDNAGAQKKLAGTRTWIRQINRSVTPKALSELKNSFLEISGFTEHYKVMQNIVFPEIESTFEKHGCLKILWSFHDDIVRNIRKTIDLLSQEPFDLKAFNVVSSRVYFNINTIIFREEFILFPVMYSYFEPERFDRMRSQLFEFKLQYAQIPETEKRPHMDSHGESTDSLIELSTGKLNLKQLELIFSHLPVDMTYVDENDEVKFYSDPKHRIFPRTKGIIGRKVQNCHPHESVHIVNKIVEAFKKGVKDEASFWLKTGDRFVLIRYFAVRDENHTYKGVLEVSQEISGIQKLKGERRLLDW